MNITLIVAVAILIEGLVEYGKSIAAMFNGKDTRTGITQIVTIVIGVGLAFAFNADMFVPLGLTVNHHIGINKFLLSFQYFPFVIIFLTFCQIN